MRSLYDIYSVRANPRFNGGLCGIARPRSPAGVTASGPPAGTVNTAYPFIATINPVSATLPITYVWKATGQLPVTHTGDLSDAITFTWSTTGAKNITVTATNAGGAVTNTHAITIQSLHITVSPLALTATLNPDGTFGDTLTIGNTGDSALTWSLTEVPLVSWLDEMPSSGAEPPGGGEGVLVAFDATGLSVSVPAARSRGARSTTRGRRRSEHNAAKPLNAMGRRKDLLDHALLGRFAAASLATVLG